MITPTTTTTDAVVTRHLGCEPARVGGGGTGSPTHVHDRGHSVETEQLVALDVLHHKAGSSSSSAGSSRTRTAPRATSRLPSASSSATRSSPTSPVPTRTSRCSRFLTLALGNALEEQPRTHTRGIYAGERGSLTLRRQRAIESAPRGKPHRWRRYDVPQHLAPETSDALRFRTVEGDLYPLDRSHRSTLRRDPAIPARVADAIGLLSCRRRDASIRQRRTRGY